MPIEGVWTTVNTGQPRFSFQPLSIVPQTRPPIVSIVLPDFEHPAGPLREAQPWPNAANHVREWITGRWPALVNIDGLWFTGSNVWSHVYRKIPRPGADLDVFVLHDNSEVIGAVLVALNVTSEAQITRPRIGTSNSNYLAGSRFRTERGQLDIWVGKSTVRDTLLDYPTDSHAHCRAAYSFKYGLTIHPNERAVQP